jgi:SAM-dependent methyltransferase
MLPRMDTTQRKLDAEKLKEYAKHVFGLLNGAVTSSLVYLGDELGLYRALAEGGPATSQELAERTRLAERWVREWLYNQGAARVLESLPDGRFALSPEGAAVLANERHPAFGAGMFSQLPKTLALVEQLRGAFQSGVGLPYDAIGPEGARGIERGFAPWVKNFLVRVGVPAIEGLKAKLEAGAKAADVGCGSGAALVELAKAFPKSDFHGYELSRFALARAEENKRAAGVTNVTFHHVDEEPLPADGTFALALTFDCLHDMTHPERALAAIRKALAPDGVLWIADIKALPTYQENVAKNPMASLMYGFSVLTCMSSALSEPGGLGLGTLGFHEGCARDMTRAAGFTRFRRLDIDHAVNAFYEARP